MNPEDEWNIWGNAKESFWPRKVHFRTERWFRRICKGPLDSEEGVTTGLSGEIGLEGV